MTLPTPSPSSARRTRVLVVDDHPLVRERLAEVIAAEPDLEVCGQAGDRSRALHLVETLHPDLVLLDLCLKKVPGLDLIKDISALNPRVRMLVVSMYDESLFAERALRAGAHGYITKQAATQHILAAVRRVLAGELYLSESASARIAARAVRSQQTGRAATDQLTDRELHVLELLGEGCSVPEIARALHLSPKTVETYRARIRDKLGLSTAQDVLKFAIRWLRTRETGVSPEPN